MLPALAIIAASVGAKYLAERGASKRRESIRNSMDAYQRSKAREGEAATEMLMAKQTPQERARELEAVTAERGKSMRDTVGAAQAFDAPAIAGQLSPDYKAAQEAEANSIAERTRRAIEQLSVMGAPTEQQQKFGVRFGRAAGTVDATNRASANVGRAYMSDIENVRPNQLLSILGDVGMSVGGGMAGQSLMGGGAPTSDGGGTTVYPDSGETTGGPVRTRMKRGFSLWGSR